MKIPDILRNEIDNCEKENFKRKLIFENMRRGKILAKTIIAFELFLAMIDVSTFLLNVDNRFKFDQYLMMYSFMIILNVLYLCFIKRYENLADGPMSKLREVEIGLLIYITLVLSWGSVLTLMDQRLYGQTIAFMLNLTICSVIYYLDNKSIVIPYTISVLILVVGLPYFQSSSDILIGHYVNLSIFIIILWLASRIIYHGFCNNYKSTVMLKDSKRQLEQEIEINKAMNEKLAMANRQLEALTLMDELTGIPNRRSFRNYIDMIFKNYAKKNVLLAIMMIDIDYFKQYNDHYGHEEGDNALSAVANQILASIKSPMEFAVRWGGEEFLFVGAYENRKKISRVAEGIRKSVSDLKIPHGYSKAADCITISIGVGSIKLDRKDDIGKVLDIADKALYEAKNSGRNRVKEIAYK